MKRMSTYTFTVEWRERLVCRCEAGVLVFEMPGHGTVFFPTEERWKEIVVAPHWGRTHRGSILAELQVWCRNEGIPLVVTDDALPTDPTWPPPR